MSDFDVDLVIGPRRAARTAWIVAACAVGVAVALAGVIVALLPLQRTEVFTVLVDGTTGAAERVYQVRPTGISDQEAVRAVLGAEVEIAELVDLENVEADEPVEQLAAAVVRQRRVHLVEELLRLDEQAPVASVQGP